MTLTKRFPFYRVLTGAFVFMALASTSPAWWNKDWSGRKSFTVDTGAEGGAISSPIGDSVVLVRLHQGNFPFELVRSDGSDLRFVAGDDETVLPHQIEKFDSLLTEAFVWVKVPKVEPGTQTKFWLYYGNGSDEMEASEAKNTYDEETMLVYHFGESGVPAVDSSVQGNTAENAPSPSEGSMIGRGVRFLGNNPVTIPASDSMIWKSGDALTWSAWIKPGSLQPDAVIFSRKEAGKSFEIGLNEGIPYVEVVDPSGTRRSPEGEALPINSWKHLAVVADGSKITLHLNGETYATLDAALPALAGPSLIGGDGSEALGFAGELDELEISRVARPDGFIQLAAIGQGGSEAAARLLVPGEDEGGESQAHNPMFGHLMLFGDIAKNMMFDGWAVIFFCGLMAIVGWTVAIRKFLYLNKIQKGSQEFEKQWRHIAADLTVLDHADAENVKSLGGKADLKTQKLVHLSPIYHIYHIGSEEIHHRLQRGAGSFQGLSARSIQAIRASLDSGLTREVHRLNDGLIFLTISIAGGPYVGLLGTVMGVMITFAVIAKSGEVEVNSIAPGIASALLATVAGLVVAIPALFIYSYLSVRIKTTVSTMQLFIDEFMTKMAEFYPTPGDLAAPRSYSLLPTPEAAEPKESDPS